MRLRSLGFLAGLSLLSHVVVADAADFSRRGSPAVVPYAPSGPMPILGWTGPYIGAVVGYGWGDFDVIGAGTVGNSGFVGGAFAGYNFQSAPDWVWGLEGDIMGSGMSGSSGSATARTRWTSTVRGRLGFLFGGNMLAYGTAGLAMMGGEQGTTPKYTATHLGWALGAGVEAMVAANMTARVEYRYSDYGIRSYGGADVRPTSGELLLGAALKF
ncbi:MAG: outer membrane beta-barrel protein [Bauldia sp.]